MFLSVWGMQKCAELILTHTHWKCHLVSLLVNCFNQHSHLKPGACQDAVWEGEHWATDPSWICVIVKYPHCVWLGVWLAAVLYMVCGIGALPWLPFEMCWWCRCWSAEMGRSPSVRRILWGSLALSAQSRKEHNFSCLWNVAFCQCSLWRNLRGGKCDCSPVWL